jgi:N-acetylglutamate synthase-like GNAT family acetyltransferase
VKSEVKTFVTSAADFQSEAQIFYCSSGRAPVLEPSDILVGARIENELIGIVRLCCEHGTYVLRTMQVSDKYQRRGIGHIMLRRFLELLRERGISDSSHVFCMPYTHLETFYGLIGFKKIPASTAPLFLQERAAEFAERNTEKSVIFMRL